MPLVAPSLCLGCYSLGPLGLLKCVETLDSVSNYYIIETLKHVSRFSDELESQFILHILYGFSLSDEDLHVVVN